SSDLGTMDGANCRSPLGVGMMDGPPIEQTWESNRAVRLENVGETDVVNPWLSNGRNDFRTLDEIVASAVRPGMTDREKAFALWQQEIRHRYHWERDNRTIAAEQDLVRDHDLIKRSHTQGILNPDRRATDEWEASIYVFEGEPAGTRNCADGTSMNMVLRPGEAITWGWGHTEPVKY